MNGVKVHISSRKLVKPASKTDHPKLLKLSLLDQHYPPYYITIAFFYTATTPTLSPFSEKSTSLQKSLSRVLVHYYPLAGRLKDTAFIDCNDQGAYFVEATTKCSLAEFLQRPDGYSLDHFFPDKDPKTVPLAIDCVLLVQLTLFSCGGMSLAICPSHKVFDGVSFCTFVQSWSDMCSGFSSRVVVAPNFVGSSFLPPRDSPMFPLKERPTNSCAIKRFVFDSSKISSLKDKIKISGVTSTELVMTLIFKSAISALRRNSGSLAPTLSLYMVDLRKRMDPPLHESLLGNLAWGLHILFEESEKNVVDMVGKMKKVITDFYNKEANKFNCDADFVLKTFRERQVLLAKSANKITYVASSLRNFPLYEMEFGWGKPIWAVGKSNYRNSIFLLDNKMGNKIEAWVTLDEQDMALFERDEELLAFASVNPSVSFTFSPRM
ncbi:hypothetical protein ACFE04_011211 [Oxalis oulophora]